MAKDDRTWGGRFPTLFEVTAGHVRRALAAAGGHKAAAAAMLGVSVKTVYNWLPRLGVDAPGPEPDGTFADGAGI